MITCKKCNSEINIVDALENSPFSWPQLQAIWHVCRKCEAGNHVRFIPGAIQLIEIVGAPGPDWKILQTQPEPSVSLRIDPGFLHVWLDGKHYEVETRK
jgi:hypothetical protein